MTFLPIVDRELRVAARLKSTYRNRSLIVAVVTGVALMMLFFGSLSSAPMYIGSAMFRTLGFLTLAFCLLEGVRKTADCLSEEKREGTLGLLFLTDLKGHDVVLGKLAAVALKSFYGLLGILPVLALPMIVGGVTPGEFWRMALALLIILFFSLCTGIWVSAWSSAEHQAMGRTLGFILLLGVVPLVIPGIHAGPLSPVYAYMGAFDSRYLTDADGYWRSLWVGLSLGVLLLAWACWAAPRCWQEKDAADSTTWRRRWERWGFEEFSRRELLRRQMLEENPVYWLAARKPGPKLQLILLLVAMAVCVGGAALFAGAISLPVMLGACVLLNLMLKMRVATYASQCFAEARRNNALEMLLATPLTVDRIINGQLLALKRIFLQPIIVILLCEIAGLTLAALATGAKAADLESASIVIIPVYACVFALDMVAVSWAGMWFGLTSKKESMAATKTILWVLLAPFLFLTFFYCFGLLPFIGYPIFWIVWASQKLRQEFRNQASRRYAGTVTDAGYPAWMASPAAAPQVIRP